MAKTIPKLTHFSDKLVESVCSVHQHEEVCFSIKPNGLWVSIEESGRGWRKWCLSEQFGLDRLTHAHDVVLTTTANLLWLHSLSEVEQFIRDYGANVYGDAYTRMIDWVKLATCYQGIIIAPYVKNYTPLWYSAWDCSSGCIWDSNAVQTITLKEEGT